MMRNFESRLHPNQPEKAEISIHEAEDLYREIRVDNELVDEDGKTAALKPGAEVDVIVEADLMRPRRNHQRQKQVAPENTSYPSCFSLSLFEATSTAESFPLFSRRAYRIR